MEQAFNIDRATSSLRPLSRRQLVAFGAMCCERLVPNYERFAAESNWANSRLLRRGLDLAWKSCEGTQLDEGELRELFKRCEQNAPPSEDFTSLYTSAAQDAVFAVCGLLDYLLEGDLNDLATIPRLATDSVDLVVQELEGMNPGDPSLEAKILGHPLMQQELSRQSRDIRDVRELADGDLGALIALRRRAQSESSLLVGPDVQ